MNLINLLFGPPKGKPFHIILDEILSKEDKKKIKSVLEKIFSMYERLADVRIARYYSDKPWCKDPNQPYCSLNYYIEECMTSNGLVDAKCLQNLSRKDPRQQKEPHYDVYIIDDFLYLPGELPPPLEIIYGVSYPAITPDGQIISDIRSITISVGIMKFFYRLNWLDLFSFTAAHLLGRFFGLPNPESPYYINSTDPRAKENPHYSSSCSYKYCVMGGIPPFEKPVDFAMKILKNNPNLYCDYDLQLLRRNLNILFGRPNYTKDKNRIT